MRRGCEGRAALCLCRGARCSAVRMCTAGRGMVVGGRCAAGCLAVCVRAAARGMEGDARRHVRLTRLQARLTVLTRAPPCPAQFAERAL